MVFHSILRRGSASFMPLAIRSLAARRAFHAAVLDVETRSQVAPQFLPFFQFVSAKPTADVNLVRVLESEIECAEQPAQPTITGEIQSPMGVAQVEFIDPREPVAVVPILRAGLALAEHASSVLPATKTYHIGMSRDEETLRPTVYLNKLPATFPPESRVFVVDPMLATGGTIVATIELIKERGIENRQIKVVNSS